MSWYLIAGLVAVGAVVIYMLLQQVTARGGTSDRDATDTANQVMGEANAFRGRRRADDPPWDGQKRMAPPTQDGGSFGGGFGGGGGEGGGA